MIFDDYGMFETTKEIVDDFLKDKMDIYKVQPVKECL